MSRPDAAVGSSTRRQGWQGRGGQRGQLQPGLRHRQRGTSPLLLALILGRLPDQVVGSIESGPRAREVGPPLVHRNGGADRGDGLAGPLDDRAVLLQELGLQRQRLGRDHGPLTGEGGSRGRGQLGIALPDTTGCLRAIGRPPSTPSSAFGFVRSVSMMSSASATWPGRGRAPAPTVSVTARSRIRSPRLGSSTSTPARAAAVGVARRARSRSERGVRRAVTRYRCAASTGSATR